MLLQYIIDLPGYVMDVMEEAIFDVRPVKAEAVAEHQGRFSAPTGRGEDE